MSMPRELRFDGEVALVTGAGRGIGRGHALELARRGAQIVVNDADGPVAKAVADEISAAGGQAVASHDSVATPAGGAAVVDHALDAFGQLDIVVSNAGILRDKSFGQLTPDLVDAVLDVHLRGAFHVLIPAWRHMKQRGYGRIVTTTSASGLFGNFGQANYGAAKAALVGLTRVLAVEGRTIGINVNAVAPAAATRMNARLLGGAGGPAVTRRDRPGRRVPRPSRLHPVRPDPVRRRRPRVRRPGVGDPRHHRPAAERGDGAGPAGRDTRSGKILRSPAHRR
jgi:NAD(P)-dependent dehydrogenase (short-subunit alcohol dehydrogenase family)